MQTFHPAVRTSLERRLLFWAVVRFFFGLLQMAGPVASLVVFARFGFQRPTLIVVAITLAIMVISLLLFRVLKVQQSGGEIG